MTEDTYTAALEKPSHAHQITGLEPGSAAWRTTITASKVPSILGVDKFGGTRYKTWMTLAGEWEDSFTGNSATDRGTFLERGIAEWWSKDHQSPVEWAGTWENNERPWAVATPDYLTRDEDGLALLEVKTASDMSDWGEEGTSNIPAQYWAQVVWQSIVTGVSRVYVTCLGPFLRRADYVVEVDEFMASMVLDEVAAFRETLPGMPGEMRPLSESPELDWQAILSTTEIVKQSVEADAGLWDEYREAKMREQQAAKEAKAVKARLMVAAADAEVIEVGGKRVASRNKSGTFTFNPVRK